MSLVSTSPKKPATQPKPDNPPTHHKDLAQYGILGGRPKLPPPISDTELIEFSTLPIHKRKRKSEDGWGELEYLYRTHLRRHLLAGGKKDLNFVRSMTISGGIAKDKAYPPELKEQLPVNVPAKLLTQINLKIGIVTSDKSSTSDSVKTIEIQALSDSQNKQKDSGSD